MASKLLFDRKWELRLEIMEETDGGLEIVDSHVINGLRVTFNIRNTMLGDPSLANFQIYNINSVSEAFLNNHNCQISMYTGYRSDRTEDYSLLFSGEVTNSYEIRQQTDIVWNVWARNSFRVLETLKPPTDAIQNPITVKDIITDLLKSTPRLLDTPSFIGNAEKKLILLDMEPEYAPSGTYKQEFDDLLLSKGLGWQVQNRKLVIFDREEVAPLATETDVIEVSNKTGLLSVPLVDYLGVKFTHLLSGKFYPGKIINIAPNTAKYNLGNNYYVKRYDKTKWRAKGKFRIYEVTHRGDTRGDNWNSELTAFYRKE